MKFPSYLETLTPESDVDEVREIRIMRTIPAREIKRRGISAVDEIIKEGPVHVIKNDEPRYVVMNEEHYQELVESYREAYILGVKEALEDVKAGRGRRTTPEELIAEFHLED